MARTSPLDRVMRVTLDGTIARSIVDDIETSLDGLDQRLDAVKQVRRHLSNAYVAFSESAWESNRAAKAKLRKKAVRSLGLATDAMADAERMGVSPLVLRSLLAPAVVR